VITDTFAGDPDIFRLKQNASQVKNKKFSSHEYHSKAERFSLPQNFEPFLPLANGYAKIYIYIVQKDRDAKTIYINKE
jgi:hypothetical protein